MSAVTTRPSAAELWIERLAHPIFLGIGLGLWWTMAGDELAVLPALAVALLGASLLERFFPARPDWTQSGGERARLVGLYVLTFLLLGLMSEAYGAFLLPAAEPLREALGARIWPEAWPPLIQALMLFFAADLIYYWIHRAIHRSSLLWRISGHGFHHAFHNLHALNVNATHPFEIVFLALPMVLLAALFDVSSAAVSGAFVLLACNATLAHANVSMNTPLLAWFFTHSNHHRRHHSMKFKTSNTNYACNAIVWDRLFGTYSEAQVEQTGIGPIQPRIRDMFLLPFREPEQADTVTRRRRESSDRARDSC
jgi:sterol desaturase/sphingolipid hydroxylase (fatty acid hydroxylase superfamily)